MDTHRKFEFSKIQKALICIAPVLFVVLVWGVFHLHSGLKKEYLSSYPANNQVTVRITYDIKRAGGSSSIGNEWTYRHFLNDKEFKNGEVLTINAQTSFAITSRFIERDSISDIGESTSKQYKYSQNDNYKKLLTVSQKVHVVERGGRRYAGATADFNVKYKLERVIPPSMRRWDLFFYTSNDTELYLCVVLIGGQILCIICVIIVLFGGWKRTMNYRRSGK